MPLEAECTSRGPVPGAQGAGHGRRQRGGEDAAESAGAAGVGGREQALQGIIDHVRDAYFKGSQSELAEFIEKNCASVPLSPVKPSSGGEEPQAGEPPK